MQSLNLATLDPDSIANALIAAEQLYQCAKSEFDNATDPQYKKALQERLNDCESMLVQLRERNVNLASRWNDLTDEEKKDISKIIKDLKGAFEGVGRTIATHHNTDFDISPPEPKSTEMTDAMKKALMEEALKYADSQLQSLARGVKEMVVVDEIAPKALNAAEAEQDPIKAAGQDLRVEASHWANEENEIVARVNKIAQKFLDLSLHHKELAERKVNPQAKKEFIQTAQDIVAETIALVKAVQPLMLGCADKRLTKQIQESTEKMITLAQTLKIIVAVKASSPGDKDKGVQLVMNAQNLVQAVKGALRNAISCSLKLKPDADQKLVRFRKVIYAKRQ